MGGTSPGEKHLAIALFQRALNVALGGFLRHIGPLIVELFAAAQAHLHLHPGVFEVQRQGDEGIALLLDNAVQPQDFMRPAVFLSGP